ncbi:hypothetical protein [Streptomyces sp. NBC_00154]|uniref:hypothetical protein n=1 Tax=Streptomyces sp. NBC_00154 TaxID=2975670 RepID=UPI002251CE53|nr:hypothetical protein [Streptomyces sp. NBC_00154]MCX5310749.1 hypothetical protein [Streptomyces sp. NBC_00154]
MNDVRELLGRAAEHAGQPVISTEVVYARAARVRWRRRATVVAAAFAVVAAGAVAVPGLASQEKPEQASVAAAPGLAGDSGDSGRVKKLVKLLPEGVGSVAQVSLAVVIKHATPQQAKGEKPIGPLDGEYSVRRDGRVGYLTLNTMDRKYIAAKMGGTDLKADLCHPTNGEKAPANCVREVLPDGRILTIWSDSTRRRTPMWAPELTARLTLGDGAMMAVRDSAGLVSARRQGPPLKTTPLTRAQLRTLMLSPELLPKK